MDTYTAGNEDFTKEEAAVAEEVKTNVSDFEKLEFFLQMFSDNVRVSESKKSIYIKGRRYQFNDDGELVNVVDYE
jgi:hypothetical protein